MKLSFVVTTHGAMKTSLLERRVRGDVGVGLDLRQRADRRVVLDERAAADDDVVADLDALAHARLVADDDARADVEPANTTAPVETIVPSPSSAGGSGSRFAVERGESEGCLPTTACSSTFTPSPSTVPG